MQSQCRRARAWPHSRRRFGVLLMHAAQTRDRMPLSCSVRACEVLGAYMGVLALPHLVELWRAVPYWCAPGCR